MTEIPRRLPSSASLKSAKGPPPPVYLDFPQTKNGRPPVGHADFPFNNNKTPVYVDFPHQKHRTNNGRTTSNLFRLKSTSYSQWGVPLSAQPAPGATFKTSRFGETGSRDPEKKHGPHAKYPTRTQIVGVVGTRINQATYKLGPPVRPE